MTYLQIVNKVLIRLRENQVSTVAESTYSSLVGELVNDANKYVEQSWDWTALRQSITVTTAADDYEYALTGSGQDFKLLNVLNNTNNSVMHYRPATYFDGVYLSQPATGSPSEFTYRGTDTNSDTNIEVYPKPDAVYSLVFKAVVRSADLEDDADAIKVPTQAVIYMALALAARERGEQGGTSAAELLALADTYLADAVALDASLYEDELTWKTT
tara:strand:+ start:40 stop:684 length:645 start_codon:yes stop_codon:yes gene_type:complete